MKIETGGSTAGIYKDQTIQSIDVICETPKQIVVYINDKSKSYLTIDEAVDLRDEINNSIKKAIGIN